MLPDYLASFNNNLRRFQKQFPVKRWSQQFRESLINDYTFFLQELKIQDWSMVIPFVF